MFYKRIFLYCNVNKFDKNSPNVTDFFFQTEFYAPNNVRYLKSNLETFHGTYDVDYIFHFMLLEYVYVFCVGQCYQEMSQIFHLFFLLSLKYVGINYKEIFQF